MQPSRMTWASGLGGTFLGGLLPIRKSPQQAPTSLRRRTSETSCRYSTQQSLLLGPLLMLIVGSMWSISQTLQVATYWIDPSALARPQPQTLRVQGVVATKEGLSRSLEPQSTTLSNEIQLQLDPKRNLDNLIIIPEYKLMFCYIEKVGCSMFNQLFRLLRMYHPHLSWEERDYLSKYVWYRNTPSHFNMTVQDIQNILSNRDQYQNWTKVLYYRDPADRFWSAFKSKCGMADEDGRMRCRTSFGKRPGTEKQPLLDGSIASFHKAIDMAYEKPSNVFADKHFSPASHFCGGLTPQILNQYDMIHLLDKKTVPHEMRQLFSHMGVDSELTEGLLERVVQTGGILQPQDKQYFRKQHNISLEWSVKASHNTGNSNKQTAQDYFGTPQRLERLQSVFASDYELFQLLPSQWTDLS